MPDDQARITEPGTHGQPGDVLGPDGTVNVHDPALDAWAHFGYEIVSDFGPGLAFRGYDRTAHKYRPNYIRPDYFELFLDAGLGLLYGAGQPVAHIASRVALPTASRVDDILDLLAKPAAAGDARLGGTDGGHNGGGNSAIPENLFAFEWIVLGHGGFHTTKIVQRPISPMQIAYIALPKTGSYSVTLRVYFADARYGERQAAFMLRDFLIVSLGDSSASGEGNPDFEGNPDVVGKVICDNVTFSKLGNLSPSMANEPTWQEKKAHRSGISGPALAALSLQRNSADTVHAGGAGPVVLDKITFASFARSGAQVVSGLLDSQVQPPVHDYIGTGQVEECRRTVVKRQINALMINIGGNDAGFSGVLTDLVKGDNVFTANDENNPAAVKARLESLLGTNLPPGQTGQIEQHFDLLNAAINQHLRPQETYITGYPVALFDIISPDGSIGFDACGIFSGPDLDIDKSDYELIKKQGADLNYLIRRKAQQFGWHYIDIAPDFVGRGYCAADTLWVGATTSCKHQGDFEGAMHPNRRGHALWALKFAAALRDHTVVPRYDLGEPPPVPEVPDTTM